jgi:hypothetical protein
MEKESLPGQEDIRTNWARQKIYHLMGQFARTGKHDIMLEIRTVSRTYRVPVPYSGEM